ncbi:hypothetical protein Tco_0449471 [Tanacetum coccineum]
MTVNRISSDPDRIWVDEILRFTEPVGYGPTMLLLCHFDLSSLMAYFVAILTPDSARPCVMQSTLPTKGMRSIISTISICLKDFMSSILLLMVIIVAVVIVTVIWVVIFVNVIVGVVIVVAFIGVVVLVMIIGIVVVVRIIRIVVVGGGVPSIIKLLFVIIGFLHRITLYYLVH